MIYRAFRYRLKPTAEQDATLREFASVTRFVYNLALEQRSDWWRNYLRVTGHRIDAVSQSAELTLLRAQVDWIAAVPVTPLQQALRDLDRAFAAFFRGRSDFPLWRRKGVTDSIRFSGRDVPIRTLNGKWAEAHIPKLGWVRFRCTRRLFGRVLNVTLSLVNGQWFVAFAAEVDREVPAPITASVGIDRGITNTLAFSDGTLVSTTDTADVERRKRHAQKVLARKVRGSNRYRKQRERLSRISAKLGYVRTDWRHKVTTVIASRYGTVAIEDLKTAKMTRSGKGKRGLNRSILEQGWGNFALTLAYKLTERGGRLIKVDPAYTSQTCSGCGTIDKASRESQASFACRHCGFAIHADTNAAINILRRSTASMCVEDRGCPTDEARTGNVFNHVENLAA